MSDTTIPALLEELREVEPLLWEKITYLDQGDRVIKFAYQVLDDFALDHLQGCIQRAILEKGWKYVVSNDRARQPYGQIGIPISNVRTEYQHRNYADTPAAALMAAYIEAVRARQ